MPEPLSTTLSEDFEARNEDLWVFAYGSLIWRPGFRYLERVPARLKGAHRALCVRSHVHRAPPNARGSCWDWIAAARAGG